VSAEEGSVKRNGSVAPLSAVKRLEQAKLEASDLASEFARHVHDLEAAKAEVQDGIESDQAEHVERMATADREHAAEMTRLKGEVAAKDARIKEIVSRFSFVVGTITEPSDRE
jgi:hypothetical protein